MTIQVTRKYARRAKVIETHTGHAMLVSMLTRRSASPTRWSNLYVVGSNFGLEMTEDALRALHKRIGEVLSEAEESSPGTQWLAAAPLNREATPAPGVDWNFKKQA